MINLKSLFGSVVCYSPYNIRIGSPTDIATIVAFQPKGVSIHISYHFLYHQNDKVFNNVNKKIKIKLQKNKLASKM